LTQVKRQLYLIPIKNRRRSARKSQHRFCDSDRMPDSYCLGLVSYYHNRNRTHESTILRAVLDVIESRLCTTTWHVLNLVNDKGSLNNTLVQAYSNDASLSSHSLLHRVAASAVPFIQGLAPLCYIQGWPGPLLENNDWSRFQNRAWLESGCFSRDVDRGKRNPLPRGHSWPDGQS
jgi:hypothetical protein